MSSALTANVLKFDAGESFLKTFTGAGAIESHGDRA